MESPGCMDVVVVAVEMTVSTPWQAFAREAGSRKSPTTVSTPQDFKAATETYKEAISLDAKNAKAWLGLGFSYLHMDRNDLSLAAFNEAIRIDHAYKEKLATVMVKLAQP